ncbi:MAG: FAD-dependent oxidoreductase [Candidatus Kapaibacteriota bacterium]
MQNSIAIVGCGISGISASIELIKRNIKHTIFEARNTIGGRFYSFYDPTFDFELDNGQHFFSSAYSNFFYVLDFLGSLEKLDYSKDSRIYFYSEGKQKFCLEKKIFGGKFGLLGGLLNLKSLPFTSRIKLLRLFLDFMFSSEIHISEPLSAYELLEMKKQDNETIKKFWEPVCISIFNNSIDKIPAELFKHTIKLAFLSNTNTLGFLYSKVPQSQLLNEYLNLSKKNGIELNLSSKINHLQLKGDDFILTTKEGREFKFKYVILCVPPNNLKKILPNAWIQTQEFKFLENVSFNPILSIYLTTKEPIISEPYGYLLGSPIHWIFNRNIMLNIPKPQNFYSITISNSHQFTNKSSEEIKKELVAEIQRHFQIKPEILCWKPIKEKFATVSIDLEFHKLRPKQETSIPGLFLAGDWTNTKLPATLESAALSGKLAVEKLLNNMGYL